MFGTIISFLPFVTCLFWLVLNPLVRKNDKKFRSFEFVLAITGIVSIAQAGICYSKGNVLLTFFLVKQFFYPLLVPAILLYISSLLPESDRKPSIEAWITIPIALLFAETILILLSGSGGFVNAIGKAPAQGRYDKIVNIIHLCSYWVFYIVLAAQILFWIISVLIRIAKKERHIQICNCTAIILTLAALEIPAVASSTPTWIQTAISIILSCVVFFTSYKEMSPLKADIVIAETHKTKESSGLPRESGLIIADAHQSLADEENLRIRFEDLIVTEQLFLKQGIRISDIATMLETNRTYVSRLVNNTYNMSFSDYMNTLRIDYAEQYLLHHKDAKQSDIAEACGFPNASAFNNVFKKITGVTPKVWLATRS